MTESYNARQGRQKPGLGNDSEPVEAVRPDTSLKLRGLMQRVSIDFAVQTIAQCSH